MSIEKQTGRGFSDLADILTLGHDFRLDYFVTPDAVIRCGRKGKQPRGIDWDILDAEKLAEIPLLRELKPRAARTSMK